MTQSPLSSRLGSPAFSLRTGARTTSPWSTPKPRSLNFRALLGDLHAFGFVSVFRHRTLLDRWEPLRPPPLRAARG